MPLIFLIISSLTNIMLDLLFITRFQMGIAAVLPLRQSSHRDFPLSSV